MSMKFLDSNHKYPGGEADFVAAARRIRLISLDIDGVLTDGRIGYGCGADEEIKFFDVKDGQGIKYLTQLGVAVGIISGRKCAANRRRAGELQLDFLREGCVDKLAALREVCAQHNCALDEAMHVGDDLIDCECFMNCGIGVAVGDAIPEALCYADCQTAAFGGRGAIREITRWLIKSRGLLGRVLERYRLPPR